MSAWTTDFLHLSASPMVRSCTELNLYTSQGKDVSGHSGTEAAQDYSLRTYLRSTNWSSKQLFPDSIVRYRYEFRASSSIVVTQSLLYSPTPVSPITTMEIFCTCCFDAAAAAILLYLLLLMIITGKDGTYVRTVS